MSKFLGPIHYWLHDKIKLQEQIELAFEQKYFASKTPDQAYEGFNEQYGPPTPSEDLENNINTANIHGWLQDRITKSETRFASKLTYLLKNDGELPLKTASGVYTDFGSQCAEKALGTEGFSGQPEIAYKLLNNYILEGMPCDQASAVTQHTDCDLEWQATRCLHKAYWEAVGGDHTMHHVLRDAFNKAFFMGVGGFNYTRVQNNGILQYHINK